MNIEEIKKKLKEDKNANFVREIEYKKNKYYMAFKTVKDGIQYYYYEMRDDKIQEVNNFRIIEYFKNYYEINDDVIY